MAGARTEILKNMSLLYVEYDEDIVDAVKFSFDGLFDNIVFASTAENALELWSMVKPDIVITDICLPFMNGIELTKIIKEKYPDTPVMIVTGYKEINMLMDSIDAKVDSYMTKPVNLRLLKQNLCKLAEALEDKRRLSSGTRLIEKVLNNSKELYLAGDSSGISYMNTTLLELLGYSGVEEANIRMSHAPEVKIAENGKKERIMTFGAWLSSVNGSDGYESMVSIMCPGVLKSDAKTFIASVSRVKEEDCYVVSFVDIGVIERQKEYFHQLAMKDPLTDIFNKTKMQDEITRENDRSGRYGSEYSVIMFDIDMFRQVNDSFGRTVGDSVLKELAGLISKNIRTTDIFARYGGEEFLIITPEVDTAGAHKLAEKLRTAVEAYEFEHAGHITCSFGIAGHREKMTPDDIIRSADEALFRAKAEGRNRVKSS
ncbi:MAG: diguanylate cyclase [Deferribacterales bacterium]